MESTASIIAIVAGIVTTLLVAIALPLVLLSKRAKEAEAKAHARRLADAEMNARLLRLDL
jgi:flagellar basal body-associated protein FliL